MQRVTSSFFVSALIRRVTSTGGFAAIVRKGADEAGGIYIAERGRNGTIDFFAPAPQSGYSDQGSGERQFQRVGHVVDDASLATFASSEAKFDPDFWIVEIEHSGREVDLFPVMKP